MSNWPTPTVITSITSKETYMSSSPPATIEWPTGPCTGTERRRSTTAEIGAEGTKLEGFHGGNADQITERLVAGTTSSGLEDSDTSNIANRINCPSTASNQNVCSHNGKSTRGTTIMTGMLLIGFVPA